MNALISTWHERWGEWLTALLQHLQISLVSLLIAIAVAVPLGILLQRRRRAAEIALQITGIVQTIPSLALLGLLIPLVGIGTVPAIIALVAYALFPIMQSTITGLNGIDPNLVEAGTAFGMTRGQRLRKFELPIAMPVIVSGVRTSAVMIIGTATLAALIGAGGLGTFILLGIDRNNNALILIGAISSALLALLFSATIHWLEHRRLRTILAGFLVLVVALIGSFAPQMWAAAHQRETIVVAGKLGPEPEILMNMYKELIENGDANVSVEVKPNFGKTTFVYEALKRGDIDIYPEFTGTVTESLLKNAPTPSTDARTVYEQARDGIREQDGLVLLEPMKFQDTYAVAVTQQYAREHGLRTISDLRGVEHAATAGLTLEFNDREDGGRGLKSKYGLDLRVRTMEPALRYQAIANGNVQIVDAYSTDAEISQYNLTTLEDDRHLFPAYQGAPMMREDFAKDHPKVVAALNKLAGRITDEEMSRMNYEVKANGRPAAAVALDYLSAHHLLS